MLTASAEFQSHSQRLVGGVSNPSHRFQMAPALYCSSSRFLH